MLSESVGASMSLGLLRLIGTLFGAVFGLIAGQCHVLFLHACPVDDAMLTVGSR